MGKSAARGRAIQRLAQSGISGAGQAPGVRSRGRSSARPPGQAQIQQLPLQAYGAAFKWESIFGGATDLHKQAWGSLAASHGLVEPDEDDLVRIADMRPERAIQQVLRWTDDSDWGET